jgi:hypothetical protein
VNARIDHLVVAADSLEQGAAWCVATFGVQPSGGGRHPLMGTHNRVMAISSAHFPDCYLEIIAIDPEAPAPERPRWFGLDQSELREAVRERPRLVHGVARTRMIETLHRGLLNCGLNPGEPQAAQRETPNGLLKWRITVRDDGRTECDGCVAQPDRMARTASLRPPAEYGAGAAGNGAAWDPAAGPRRA